MTSPNATIRDDLLASCLNPISHDLHPPAVGIDHELRLQAAALFAVAAALEQVAEALRDGKAP